MTTKLLFTLLLLGSCTTAEIHQLPPTRTADTFNECRTEATANYPYVQQKVNQPVTCKLVEGALSCAERKESDAYSIEREVFLTACLQKNLH